MHPDMMMHIAADRRHDREAAAAAHRQARIARGARRTRWRPGLDPPPGVRLREALGYRLIETGLRVLPMAGPRRP